MTRSRCSSGSARRGSRPRRRFAREEARIGQQPSASEAELIETYLPAQLSDAELDELVDGAVEEAGASEPREMGKVMSLLMPRVGGRADGKRVSAAVKERLDG